MTKPRRVAAQDVPGAMPAHIAALVTGGEVRPANRTRHLPKPSKPRGSGKTAADYVAEGRR
jgi:hypothetical protein